MAKGVRHILNLDCQHFTRVKIRKQLGNKPCKKAVKLPNLGCFFKISCISLVLSKLPESLKYKKKKEAKHLIIRYLTSLVLVGHLGLEPRTSRL